MLKKGIYEHIINEETERNIQKTEQQDMVLCSQEYRYSRITTMLANYLAQIIREKLEDTDSQQERINLVNNILQEAGLVKDMQIVEPSHLLLK
jgi:replicative DNA helicase